MNHELLVPDAQGCPSSLSDASPSSVTRESMRQQPRRAHHLDVYTLRDLSDRDLSTSDISRRLANGRLIHLGHNRYGTPDTPDAVVRALRAGARLTCADALTLHGFWAVPRPGTHVTKLRMGSRSSEGGQRGLVFHDPALQAWPDESALLPPLFALKHAVRCLGVEDTAIIIESGLRHGLLSRSEIELLLDELPQRTRTSLGTLRSDADAGTETRVRRFFEKMRVSVRAQVSFLDGRWRVDLLVGEVLVIECDSIAHHTGVENHARTYQKRLELQQLGLVVVNLTYAQVMFEWKKTQDMLRTMIRDGRHRARRRSTTSR